MVVYKWTIFVLLAFILIDDYFAFSHTIINSYKVEYMMKLEAAKKQYKEDTAFVARIDHLIEFEHNRQGTIEKFSSLFSSKIDKNQQIQFDELYHKLLIERDPIIHTFTGAFVTVFFMLFSIIAIVINLFKRTGNYLDMIFRTSIMFVICSCMTYYISLSWMLLDPISGHLWINYIIQALVNIIIIILILAHIVGIDHGERKDKEVEKIEEFENP